MRITVAAIAMTGFLGLSACSSLQTTSAAGASESDAELRQAARSKLDSDTRFAQVDVSADARDNQITLSGSVTTEQARTDAVHQAKSARPNLTVVDKIEVNPAGAVAGGDSGAKRDFIPRSDYTNQMAENARAKARELGEQVGKTLDDAWIYTRIKSGMASAQGIPALKINVDVSDHVVTLRGHVDTADQRTKAEEIARDTDGVREVHDEVQVGS